MVVVVVVVVAATTAVVVVVVVVVRLWYQMSVGGRNQLDVIRFDIQNTVFVVYLENLPLM